MSSQTFRLFINNVTENIDEESLKEKLSQFGNVTSIEIKQRKNIIGNQTPTFAYINIDTSHENLQKCFKKFSTEKFKNIYVDISVAKESFMDRLKREREQNQQVESQNHVNLTNAVISDEKCKSDWLNKGAIKDSSSKKKAIINSEVNFLKKSEKSVSISEQKRLQSIAEKRREFNSQKHVLKEALSRIESKPKSKIIFDSEELHSNFHENDKSKVSSDFQLFDDGEDEININFDVKELNKDVKGQKLFNLERTFTNDKRFKIDSRFSGNNFSDEDLNDDKKLDDNGIIDSNTEKEEQMKILEQVIGRNLESSNYYVQVKPSSNKSVSGMVRYDPDHKDHHKYEIVASVDKTVETKKGRKRKASVNTLDIDKKVKKPQVSQEKFYNITDNLREALQTEQQFSLLQTFGEHHHHHQNNPDENYHVKKITKSHLLINNTNPFKYDSSSDSEGEIIEKNDEQKIGETNLQNNNYNNNQNKLGNQRFFFKDDDYRLQEGLDFVKRLDTEEHTDFLKLRRDIKEVAKAKVRNNLRKKRQFKTKLGGKKRIKIKRALKR